MNNTLTPAQWKKILFLEPDLEPRDDWTPYPQHRRDNEDRNNHRNDNNGYRRQYRRN